MLSDSSIFLEEERALPNIAVVVAPFFIAVILLATYAGLNPILEGADFQSWEYGSAFADMFPMVLLLFGILFMVLAIWATGKVNEEK